MDFIVTEKAKRPARPDDNCCFYCQQKIGDQHKNDCVLIKKQIKYKITLELEASIPNFWGAHEFEFCRNDGTYCADNFTKEIEEKQKTGCLCSVAHFKFIKDISAPQLDE